VARDAATRVAGTPKTPDRRPFSPLSTALSLSKGPSMPSQSANSRRPPKFVSQIVRAAHKLTSLKRPPCWASLYDVVRVVGRADEEAIGAALTYAVENNLLQLDGAHPPHLVWVTDEGTKLATGIA
jgi:hypothetical protein